MFQIRNLICDFIITVCDFAKFSFFIILICFCSARYACCRYQLKISVICISNHTTCGGIFNTGNPRMFFIAIIGDRISSASGICHYTLVICYRRDGQNITLCILDPIQFAICIEVILRLCCICDGVLITRFCHSAMSVQALKSTFSIILKCSVRAIGQNNLIITSSWLYNLADINIKIPTNSERALFITGRIVSADKIRCDTGRSYT